MLDNLTEDHNIIEEFHRKEDSDRVLKDSDSFLDTQKHTDNSLEKDENDSCQIPNMRSAAASNFISKQRGCSNFSDRLSDCSMESETQERNNKGSKHSSFEKDDSLRSYEENKNLLSQSKIYNSQNSDNEDLAFQTKNGLQNYLCVSNCKIDRCDQEMINGVNRFVDSSIGRREESIKISNRFFNDKKVNKVNQRDSMSLDPNCRKSPVHGKAPKNLAYPSEVNQSDDFHNMSNSLEGLSMDTFTEELTKYDQDKNSMEPSVAERFIEIKPLSNHGSFRDYNKVIADQNNVLSKAKLHRISDNESAVGVIENSGEAVVNQTEFSDSIDSKKSEDNRNITLKRSLPKRSEFFEVALRPRKESKTKSNRKSMKSRSKKSQNHLTSSTVLTANSKKYASLANPSGRLTRSQKKDVEKVTTVAVVGAADDDSGIQGDIYEFSEKDSNLENVSLTSVMRHKFERRSPNQVVMHLQDNRSEEEVKVEPELISRDRWTHNDLQDRSHNFNINQSEKISEKVEEKQNG